MEKHLRVPEPKPKPTPKPAPRPKPSPKITARDFGLRNHQLRVLRILKAAGGPLSKLGIAAALDVHEGLVQFAIGTQDSVKRAAYEAKEGYPSLLTLGYVTMNVLNMDGIKMRVYGLTEAGVKATVAAARAILPSLSKRRGKGRKTE